MTIIRIALMVILALSACSPAAVRNEAEAVANTADDTIDEQSGNALANDLAAPKSILRPDVVEPEPTPTPVEPLQAVVPFAAGMALDDAGRQAIDAALADPAFAAGGAVTLRGHSDSRGNDGDNLVASRKRAEAVRAYLLEKGVAPDRIVLVALGKARPVAPNARRDGTDDPEGRARNRRVEIEVSLPEAPPASPRN